MSSHLDPQRELARAAVGGGFAAVILGVAVTSAVWARPGPVPRPEFDLNGWRPDSARLAGAWTADEALAARFPLDEAGRAVILAVELLGSAETPAGGNIADPAYAAATAAAVDAATAYWFSRGADAYKALGVHARREFEATVSKVLGRATAAGKPIRPWLKNNEADPDVVRLRAVAGNFVENAVGWGLIEEPNQLAGGGPELLRIHFKVRWARLVSDVTDYTFILSPEELRALWRWRVEGDRNLAMDQRVRVAGWLRQQVEPNYPALRVLGTLFALRGQSDVAIGYYREALLDDPFDAVSAQNLEYLLHARAAASDEEVE